MRPKVYQLKTFTGKSDEVALPLEQAFPSKNFRNLSHSMLESRRMSAARFLAASNMNPG